MKNLMILMALAALAAGATNAASAQAVPPLAPAGENAAAPNGEPTLAQVMAELGKLREEVARMQESVQTFTDKTIRDLRAENERLRQEIIGLYRESRGRAGSPARGSGLPMPDQELLKGLDDSNKLPGPLGKAVDKEGAETQTEPQPQEPAKAAAPPKGGFEVVAEWGRTPAEVAASDKDPKPSSLKGMVGVVPDTATDADLITLARELRARFDEYENVNIEVFDDVEAARAYKQSNIAPPEHRVLSISKHPASNRDVILLIRGGKATEIPIKE